MADPSEDLNAKLKAAAKKKVGGDALTSKFGYDCFALVDALLRSVNANSAHDYKDEVPITATAHYKWGDGILLDSIQPGDILQFRKHVVEIVTWTRGDDGKWHETESRTLRRPHHTAIILEVRKDGSVLVVEQNLLPNPKKVMQNVIPRLAEGEDTQFQRSEKKTRIKVTGSVSAYRPVPKAEKDASLLHGPSASGRRSMASFIPAEGGPKRPRGPIGLG